MIFTGRNRKVERGDSEVNRSSKNNRERKPNNR